MTTSLPPLHDALAIHLAPGESTLVCMPCGSTLRLRHGRLALHTGPLVLGQVIASAQPCGTLDGLGDWTAPDGGAGRATWLRITNSGAAPAAAWLIEAAPQAGDARLWAMFREWFTRLRPAHPAHPAGPARAAARPSPFGTAGSR